MSIDDQAASKLDKPDVVLGVLLVADLELATAIVPGVRVDLAIVNAKLSLYQTTFAADLFRQKVDGLEAAWESDLRPLLGQIPEFSMARERMLGAYAALG